MIFASNLYVYILHNYTMLETIYMV